MRFPNLFWAIEQKRLAHYELAARVGMDASRFSRCLRGRFEFVQHQKQRIAEVLALPARLAVRRTSTTPRVRSNGITPASSTRSRLIFRARQVGTTRRVLSAPMLRILERSNCREDF